MSREGNGFAGRASRQKPTTLQTEQEAGAETETETEEESQRDPQFFYIGGSVGNDSPLTQDFGEAETFSMSDVDEGVTCSESEKLKIQQSEADLRRRRRTRAAGREDGPVQVKGGQRTRVCPEGNNAWANLSDGMNDEETGGLLKNCKGVRCWWFWQILLDNSTRQRRRSQK